jgi:hypothetical protein
MASATGLLDWEWIAPYTWMAYWPRYVDGSFFVVTRCKYTKRWSAILYADRIGKDGLTLTYGTKPDVIQYCQHFVDEEYAANIENSEHEHN